MRFYFDQTARCIPEDGFECAGRQYFLLSGSGGLVL